MDVNTPNMTSNTFNMASGSQGQPITVEKQNGITEHAQKAVPQPFWTYTRREPEQTNQAGKFLSHV